MVFSGPAAMSCCSVQGVVSLVVDDIPMVAHEVIHSETSEEHTKEVKWQRPRLLWLPVVSAQHRPCCLGRFNEVVVRDLGEEVVDDMGADVVVDVVDPAVVPVHCGEAPTQVAPLLAAVPGEVMAAVVVQVGHQVKPHDKHKVWDAVHLEHLDWAEGARHGEQRGEHDAPAGG